MRVERPAFDNPPSTPRPDWGTVEIIAVFGICGYIVFKIVTVWIRTRD